jgi:acetylornithine/succinyldiaminopimelate/putrescine aminotransferase
MALAVLDVIDRQHLVARAASEGAWFAEALAAVPGVTGITGSGLMLGVHMPDSLGVTRRMMARGYIVLPAGERAEALGLTPPLTTARAQLEGAVLALTACM